MSSDDILNFITKDVKKERSPAWRLFLFMALAIPFLSFLFYNGVRVTSLDFSSNAILFAFCSVLLLPVAVFPLVAKRGMIPILVLFASVVVGAVASLFLSLPGRHETELSAEILSLINQKCFSTGLLLGGIMSLLVQLVMTFFAPTMAKGWRYSAAIMGGFAGYVTLFMYCPVVGLNHMFYGHFTQFMLVSVFSIVLSQLLFTLKVKRLLPSQSIKKKGKLGE